LPGENGEVGGAQPGGADQPRHHTHTPPCTTIGLQNYRNKQELLIVFFKNELGSITSGTKIKITCKMCKEANLGRPL